MASWKSRSNASAGGALTIDLDDWLTDTRACLLENTGLSKQTSCDNNNENAETDHYYHQDTPAQMTGGRLLARFLSQFWLYYPQKANPKVNLDRAWAHYEHVTLGRIYVDDQRNENNNNVHHQKKKDGEFDRSFVRAPPGERRRPTQLYPLIRTPTEALSAFGVSVRLYFSTLLVLAAFLSVAAVLNLPLGWYFAQPAYSEYAAATDLPWAVQASAVCADTEWVQCGDNSCAAHSQEFKDRILAVYENNAGNEGGDADNNDVVYYYLKNTCDFESWLWPALCSYGASVLLVIQFGIAFFWLQRRAEIVFDEQLQTASDYSIKISNPPPDATDPEEWKQFLEPIGGKVALCTVTVNNAKLLTKLVHRRRVMKQLQRMLPDTVDVEDPEELRQAVQARGSFCCSIPILAPSVHSLHGKVIQINNEIQSLINGSENYKAVAVYVTFHTERAQRNALHALSTGKIHVWRNTIDTSRFQDFRKLQIYENADSSKLPANLEEVCTPDSPKSIKSFVSSDSDSAFERHSIRLVRSDDSQPERTLDQKLRFRGKHVLYVKEAPEPSDIRWKDLEVSSVVRATKFFGTILAMIWFIGWSALLIWKVETNDPGTMFTPLFITVTNIIVPKICEIVNGFESHSTEGARQSSLYIKVVLFRCFNSAFALLIVKGFTGSITLDEQDRKENLNQAIFNLIYAEMFTIPIIKLVDIMGIIRKHILAPRAKDQEEMNSYFAGAKFELAERYTDATKVIFVSLMYSTVLPVSLLLGALALLVHYIVGKFCLLRMWRATPDVGTTLSRVSRNYFFSTSLLAHVIMAAFWWSGYPYDDLCENDDGGYKYCSQDFFRQGVFPPLPRFQPTDSIWMTPSQALITSLYSWTGVVMIVVAIIVAIKECLVPRIQAFFYSTYEPDGKDQGIPLSHVVESSELQGYLPQLRENGFAHPLLACDFNGVDTAFVGWTVDDGDNDDGSNEGGFQSYNLMEDARKIMGSELLHEAAFAKVRQWSVDE